MTEEQIPKLVAMLVEHQKFFAGLAREDAQWAIQHPREAIQIMCGALDGVSTPSQLPPAVDIGVGIRYRLKVWKTIQSGGVARPELSSRVDRVSTMGSETQVLVRRQEFAVSDTRRPVNLVCLTPAQMGFTSPPTTDELLSEKGCIAFSTKWLIRQAIRLCLPGLTLDLFLGLLPKEKENLEVWIAMKTIPSAIQGGMEAVMGIDPECGVHFRKLRPDHRWSLNTKLVFILDELPPPPPTALPPPVAPAP